MIEIKCSVETQNSKYLLETIQERSKKTKACLMKIYDVGGNKTKGEKLGDTNGKIIQGKLEIQGNVEIDVNQDQEDSTIIIEILPY